MKILSVLVGFLALTASAVSSLTTQRDLIAAVNSADAGWVAGVNSKFADVADFNEVRNLMGALETPEHMRLPIKLHHEDLLGIPENFDAREAWPHCKSIGEIRDQSNCGSCWAFGAVSAATDRICITTGGKEDLHLSATDMLACCGSCGFGCNGGYPDSAWRWLAQSGCVTGGNYGDKSLCWAYPFEVCNHHVDGSYPDCKDLNGGRGYDTPRCTAQCDRDSTYTTPYAADKKKFASAYGVSSRVEQIQMELMKNGPVEVAFTVYADFMTYRSGIYKHVTGQSLGGHAVKMLGWGTENGVDYWLIANSWNEEWGENGYFRIRRGNNECGIESRIVAGLYRNN